MTGSFGMGQKHKMMISFVGRRRAQSGRVMSLIAVAAFSVLGLSGLGVSTADDNLTNGVGAGDRPVEAASSQDTPPEGLTNSDWKSIRGEYERHRHAAVCVDGGFRAHNPGQHWQTDFDGRGFIIEPAIAGEPATAGVHPNGADWRWGLELQSCGFLGHERAVASRAAMSAQDDRVSYDWGAGLTEWFVNGRRGLEHGFTLDVRPPREGNPQAGASDWLELRLAVRGGLRPQGQADGRGVSFVGDEGHAIIHYTGLKVWDADQQELPARLEADGAAVRLAIDERHARYPVTIDPVAQQAYLKASNTGSGDLFGVSVAVSGDTVVVGANREDSNATGVNGNQANNSATDSGAAYVFVRDDRGIWSQQAYLKASNTGAGDRFAHRVAVSGDTVVVGAYLEDSNATGVNGNQANNSATDSGAAYVFVRDGGGWNQQAYLKASNTGVDDYFGWSVAVSGDTVVVGAYLEDSNATGVNGDQTNGSAGNSGAAYVFVRDGDGVWSQQAYLKASNTAGVDHFGLAVAVSDDTVVVGAYAEDSNATGVNGDQTNNSAIDSGAAYVFVRDSGGVWSQQAYLKASNTGIRDFFGFSLAVSDDTVVVGAYSEASNATGVNGDQTNNSASISGAASVFVRDGGGVWSQQAYLKASNTGAGDRFGISVDMSGDTVVIGAYFEASNATGVNGDQTNDSASSSGAAYVFIRDGSAWSQQAYLKASNTEADDVFGWSVAVSGDTVVVGAISEASNATGVNGNQTNNSATDSGAAYVFNIPRCASDLDCADQNVCTCDRCVANVCQNIPNEYGNADCMGILKPEDVICVLMGYADVSTCPNGDLDPPCTGDDPPFIELGDVLGVLSAYNGGDPCGCPP